VSAELVHRLRPARTEPEGALVLMHGRGADEHDLEPLVGALDPARRLVGLLPRGPLSLPPGGAHWYVVKQVGFPDPDTFLPTFEQLADWVDSALAEVGLAHERLVLAGFSQGAVMAYSLALGDGRPKPAGVVAMSGFLPQVDGFDIDLDARAGLPVAVSHGTLDPVIGIQFGRAARGRLTEGGLDVRYVEEPVGHTIGPGALTQARALVADAVA